MMSTEEYKRDSERLVWWFTTSLGTVDINDYMEGIRSGYTMDQWRQFIDDAMEAAKREAEAYSEAEAEYDEEEDIRECRTYAEAEGLMPEFCICSAIRMPDGEVIYGHRHSHCLDVVRARTDVKREDIVKAEQGFVTSTGQFVDRVRAMEIQKQSGRPSKYLPDGVYFGTKLFSEDLY